MDQVIISLQNINMIDLVQDNIEILSAVLLLVLPAMYILFRRIRVKRSTGSAAVFRGKILTELEGLYPVPRYVDKEVFERFSRSIPSIEAAAAEFRPYVSREDKNAFDTALQHYREHCSTITWESCVTYNVVPGKRKPEEEGPKEIFRQSVSALLSFAKK